MQKTFKIQFFLSLALVIFSNITFSQVPQLINYQGVLVDPATGQPVPDDTYSIIFSIYDVASGGSDIWSEPHSVDTKNGLYSVILGSIKALTPTILSGPEKYLGIKVGDDPEMTPRKRIVSVAYSILSEDADKVDGKHASAFADSVHSHDDRYYTKSELNTSDGDPPNQGSNRMSWDNLTDVPEGFADGVDNTGGGSGGWVDDGVTVRLETSTDKVGIGTTNPTEVLEVVGNMKSSGKVLASAYSSNSPLIFEAPVGTERARINDLTGNMGIGTSLPSFRLEVSDNYTNNINPLLEIERTGNNSASSMRFKNGSGDFFNIGITRGSHFAVSTLNQNISLSSDLLTILNSGKVGIGTNQPGATLDVNGTVQLKGFKLSTMPALGYVLTSDEFGNGSWQAVSGSGNGCCSLEYPDGVSNITPFFYKIMGFETYTVPAGQNLYITKYKGYDFKINNKDIVPNGEDNEILKLPIIVGAGQTVYYDAPPYEWGVLNGFLTNATVTPVLLSELTSGYIVAAGKTLVVTSILHSNYLDEININGETIYLDRYNSGRPAYILFQPIIVGSGQTLSSNNNSIVVNGYLK